MAEQIAAGAQGKMVMTVVVPPAAQGLHRLASRKPVGLAGVGRRNWGECVIVAAFQNIAAGHLRDLDWQPDCDVLYTGDGKEASRRSRFRSARRVSLPSTPVRWPPGRRRRLHCAAHRHQCPQQGKE